MPISRKSFGCFSVTSLGTGSLAAASANSPKLPEWLPLFSTPLSMVMLAAGTFHVSAAAAMSICRAAAPALRSCSQLLAIEVDPPVPWIGPNSRLL